MIYLTIFFLWLKYSFCMFLVLVKHQETETILCTNIKNFVNILGKKCFLRIFVNQMMLFVHVPAIYILPHFELSWNIKNNTVGAQHLWQGRVHLVSTTCLQFQTRRIYKTLKFMAKWQHNLGKLHPYSLTYQVKKNIIEEKPLRYSQGYWLAQIAKLLYCLHLIHVNL